MNQKAKELHMEDTHFENPSGFDSPGQYTTAKDLSILAGEVLKNDLLNKIIATYGITLTDITGKKGYSLKNVNQFLGYLYGADGVKTGFTDLAGQCLISSVSRNGHRVVAVVLKSQDRFGDSARLIEWVYRNFQWISFRPSD
jgi:D-alanyl-D-alanine carboxypeptidase (penicillin-binding protein 5/6)